MEPLIFRWSKVGLRGENVSIGIFFLACNAHHGTNGGRPRGREDS